MRNKVNHQLEINKRKYYQFQFLECGNDSAKMWKLVNTLTNSQVKPHSYPNKLLNPINSQHTGNPEKMANIFSDYFVTVGKHIANSITPPCNNKYPVAYNGPDHSFVWHETLPEEVEAVINRLLECKSVRMNDIPIYILKLCKNALSPFLAQIFYHCIRKGTYPKRLTCAQVLPIYKGGQKDLCNNYRPTSFLSPINKIFEKLLHGRLYSYIEQHNMLSTKQYG